MIENRSSALNVTRPDCMAGSVYSFKEFPGFLFGDSVLWYTHKYKVVRRGIGQWAVM
jgi:hypothetical protein